MGTERIDRADRLRPAWLSYHTRWGERGAGLPERYRSYHHKSRTGECRHAVRMDWMNPRSPRPASRSRVRRNPGAEAEHFVVRSRSGCTGHRLGRGCDQQLPDSVIGNLGRQPGGNRRQRPRVNEYKSLAGPRQQSDESQVGHPASLVSMA